MKKFGKENKVYILGITGLSTAFHDNSAALTKDGKVIFAASEERYSRIKHDKNFPILSIKEALSFSKISKKDINIIAVGYPNRLFLLPFLGPNLFDLFVIVLNWIKGRKLLFVLDVLKILYGEIVQNSKAVKARSFLKKKELVYVSHHQSHAASAYFTSGYSGCLAVCMDAFGPKLSGQLVSGAVYLCKDSKIGEPLEEIAVNSSIGLFYTAVTQALGFTPGDGEGKTMGLAAYGNSSKVYVPLSKIAPHFKFGKWLSSPYWAEMFFSIRKEFRPIFNSLPIEELISRSGRENVAASAQRILEEEVVKYFRYLVERYKETDLVLAGGLFLNVKMNKSISEIRGVKGIYVQPNAGDGGAALGAALQVYSEKYGFTRTPSAVKDVSWGSGFTESKVLKVLRKYKKKIFFRKYKEIPKIVARELVAGKVVGWFQGRSEWGPRALGYRSVLIDPRRMDIKEKLNNTLKNREWFMPFAPSILEEYGNDYFLNYKKSPFMTTAFDVKKKKVKEIQAAIHVDNTARPNTVSNTANPFYYKIIKEFYGLTGIPVILNTSFNKHGLPIVNSPEDAINHLLWDCIDELAIGDYIVTRKDNNVEPK